MQMTGNNTKKEAALHALLAAVLTALFFTGTILLYEYTYGVVDDPFIASVLNGAYTGTPDAHVVYIKYPLAFLLKTLFVLIPQVNWHFLLLTGCFAVCFFVVNFRICSNGKSIAGKIAGSLLFMLGFWLCMQKMALTAHYSMCAAVLSGTGIFYFATIKKESGRGNLILNYLAAFLMLWTAYGIRARTLFMLLPLAGTVFLYRFFQEKPAFQKKHVIRMLLFPVILFLGLGGMELLHNSAYRSSGWQKYLTFNDARTTLYDFYGLPSYEKNRELYDSLGISEAREYMYEKYYLEFQDGVAEDALTQIADYRVAEAAEQMPAGKRLAESLKALPEHLTKKTYAPVNWICGAGFLLLLLYAILRKQWRLLWAVILGIFTSLIPWVWMIYMGKPTSRVTMGIWAADLLFIVALLIDQAPVIREIFRGKKALPVMVAAALGIAFLAGNVAVYPKTTKSIAGIVQSGELRGALEAWCEERPENLYIMESELVSGVGYGGKDLDNREQNLNWPGGWTAMMPLSREIWAKYGVKDIEKGVRKEDNIYIMAFAETDMSYWTDFYREEDPSVRIEKTDELELSGTKFTVYQLQEK